MLVAAGVLFYVSYWLISKSKSLRWQQWIRGQINKALSRGSLFAWHSFRQAFTELGYQ